MSDKIYVELSEIFDKWIQIPGSTENFWRTLNEWHASNTGFHRGLQPQQTILAIFLEDIERGSVIAARTFLKMCCINGSAAYGVFSMGMFKSLFRLLRPAHRTKDLAEDEENDSMDQDEKQVLCVDPNLLEDLIKEIHQTLFPRKKSMQRSHEIGLLNSLVETVLTNILQYKPENKLSPRFYKISGDILKCVVSSAGQVLSTGSSADDVVAENCADLLLRLLPIVMMVKYVRGSKRNDPLGRLPFPHYLSSSY